MTTITTKTRINDLIDKYDFMLDFLIELSPRFKLLRNPMARRTVGNVATLGQAASIGGIPLDQLIERIASKIEEMTGETVSSSKEGSSENLTDPRARHEVLKDIIRDLHDGADMEDVKSRFHALIRDIDPSEISAMEQKLMEEGMPESEIKRLCDVHVQVFRDALEIKEAPSAPENHPVTTFMLENRASEELMKRADHILIQLGAEPDQQSFERFRPELESLVSELQKIDLHYLRKENQLFPVLEKKGISGPTQVMWSIHDDIRKLLKEASRFIMENSVQEALGKVCGAIQSIKDMIYKEEHILYPLAMDSLDEKDWSIVRQGEEEIGYAWIEPPGGKQPAADHSAKVVESAGEGNVKLDMGCLTAEQINLLFRHLPVDISFVDEKDQVAYYSDTPERIFPRSAGVIGRKVQNCHPPKSVHVVQQILDDFRSGARDVAEFWIQSQGKFIHIRYFALRDGKGAYRGCVEVAQDVTEIRKLEGEKRLL